MTSARSRAIRGATYGIALVCVVAGAMLVWNRSRTALRPMFGYWDGGEGRPSWRRHIFYDSDCHLLLVDQELNITVLLALPKGASRSFFLRDGKEGTTIEYLDDERVFVPSSGAVVIVALGGSSTNTLPAPEGMAHWVLDSLPYPAAYCELDLRCVVESSYRKLAGSDLIVSAGKGKEQANGE